MKEVTTLGTKRVPASFGPLAGANGNARVTEPGGITMEFWVRVDGGIVREAAFITDGDTDALACGAAAAAIASGATVEKASLLSREEVLRLADSVSPKGDAWALLAANALQGAIQDQRDRSRPLRRPFAKKAASARSILQPRPNLLVSCRGADGRDNALVVVYAANCSYDPPMVMVGIVPTRYSYGLVKESGCFVVNLVSRDQKPLYDYLGSHSGREEDKLAALGARTRTGDSVQAPLLLDCPVNVECTVVDSIRTGSHELFIGKIERVHADEDLVKPDGTVDWERVSLL